jgi:hypothetical protein
MNGPADAARPDAVHDRLRPLIAAGAVIGREAERTLKTTESFWNFTWRADGIATLSYPSVFKPVKFGRMTPLGAPTITVRKVRQTYYFSVPAAKECEAYHYCPST